MQFPAWAGAHALACALACAYPFAGYANPVGPQVVSGSANFQGDGNTFTVRNSAGAIINWQQFSIGAQETTRFVQPSAASSVLNRVIGQNPSDILGRLSSNGRVFLINPNGIVFGAGARIDTAGLVASSLSLTDQDFLNGRLRFSGSDEAGAVRNFGRIDLNGGPLLLIAPRVENHGVMVNPGGQVVLAAGSRVEVADPYEPNLRVAIEAGGSALNVGQVLAAGGTAGLYGALVRQDGLMSADGAERNAAGRIVLRASRSASVGADSRTSARGGEQSSGGSVTITADQVEVGAGAQIDVSGGTGGGQLRVGGAAGGAPELPAAQTTRVASGAELLADALTSGAGGNVVVWADGDTHFDGRISARGGTSGGDGGFAEISGKENLWLSGHADLSAVRGAAGTLLLDPGTVTIGTGSASGPNSFGTSYMQSQLAAGNLTISTSNATNSGTQDINWASGASLLSTSANRLTLIAGNDITLASNITMPNGNIDLQAGNTINFSANITQGSSSTLSFRAGQTPTLSGGMVISGGTVRDTGTSGLRVGNGVTTGTQITLGSSSGNVTLASRLTIMEGSVANIVGNLALSNATISINSTSTTTTSLQAQGNATVSGSGQIEFAGTGTGGKITPSTSPTSSITLGSGVTVRGTQSGTILMCRTSGCDATTGKGTIFGTINADTAGKTITIQGTNWTNAGTLLASGGIVATSGTWSGSTGGLVLQSGSLRLGGTLPVSALRVTRSDNDTGALVILGVVDNTGNTLVVNSALGTITMGDQSIYSTGYIQNGRVQIDGGAFYFSYGGFNNTTLSGDLVIGDKSNLRLLNTLTLADNANIILQGGASGQAYITPGVSGGLFTIDGTGSIRTDARILNKVGESSTGSMVLGSGITVRGTQPSLLGFGSGENRATIITDAGVLTTIVGSAWTNSGEIRITNGSLLVSGLAGNTGSINLAAGTSANVSGTSWSNAGAFNIDGALTTSGFATNASSGTVSIASGSSWTTSDTPFTNNGSINLSGTIDLTSTATKRTLTNNGTLKISGLASVDGNLAEGSGGRLQFNIAEANRGTQYDALDLSGSMTFNGALEVTQSGGFAPSNGDIFRLIRYAARSGSSSFSTLSLPSVGNYNALYGAGTFVLGSGVSALNEWNSDLSGDWATASRWSLNHAPLANEAVIIDRLTASPTVSVTGGNQSGASLFSSDPISISGGSLTLGAASTLVTAPITISGGTLIVNGAASLSAVSLGGGALTLGATTNIASLAQTGGDLGGSGNLTLSGNSSWSGGSWGGGGTTTIGNGILATISGAVTLSGRNISNAGSLTIAGTVELEGTSVLTNVGSLVLQSGTVSDAAANPGSLSLTNNLGANITKSETGDFTLQATFANLGMLGVQAGTLFAPGLTTNGGTITISAGSVLSTAGGALGNDGSITLSGGTLASGPLANNANRNISGTGTLDLGGASLTNAGLVSPGGAGATGTLTIVGDYAQTGSGQVDAELASSSDYDRITASGTISLAGRLVISQLGGYEPSVGASHTLLSCSGAGTCLSGTFAEISYPANGNLTPVYAAQSFSLNLIDLIKRWVTDADGDWSVGSNWSGGTVPVVGDHVVIDRGSANPIVSVSDPREIQDMVLTETVRIVNGGSLSISQTVNLSGLLEVAGGSATLGGAVNGGSSRSGAVLLSAGGLSITGESNLLQLSQSGGSFTQSGGTFGMTTAVLSGGTTNLGGGVTVDSLTVGGSAAASFSSTLTSGSAVTINAGSLAVTGSANLAALTVSGGSTQLNGGLNASGTTQQGGGTLAITGATSLTQLSHSGGAFTQTGGAFAATTADLSGGTTGIGGDATIANLSVGGSSATTFSATLSSGGSVTVSAGALDVTGAANLADLMVSGGSTQLNVGLNASGTTQQSAGTLGVAGTVSLNQLSQSGGGLTQIGGTFAATTADLSGGTTNLGGNATITSLTVRGSSATTLNGTLSNSGGTTLIGGSLSLNASSGIGGLSQSGGTLDGGGNISLSGSSTWSGGLWSGSGTTTIAGGASLQVTDNVTLGGRSVTNAGAVTLGSAANAANIELDGAANLNNQGTLTLQNGAIADASGTAGSLNLINEAGATISKTGATAFNLGATLDNSGSLNVTAGSLTVANFASGQNPGTITIEAGSTLAHGSGALTNTGSVNGSGVLALAGATLTNAGTVSPGGAGATGTLTIVGDYAQTGSGQLNAELASGSDYDRITASGTISLNGQLAISQLGGYEPSVGASHTILTCSGAGTCLSGTFAQISYPANGNLTPVYAGQSFSLNLIDLIKRWLTDADGNWEEGANWSGGSAPVAGQDASIERAGADPVVTISSSAAARNLTLSESIHIGGSGALSLSGGLNAAQSPSGSVQLDAGAGLTISGTANLANLSLGGGNAQFNGGLTSNGVVSQSGGTLGITGTASLNQLTQSGGGLTQTGGTFAATTADLSGGTSTISGDATITSLTVRDSSATTLGGTLTNSGGTNLSGGSLSLNASSGIGGLSQSGGTLDGGGNISLSGSSTWSGGRWSGSGSTTIASGGSLQVTDNVTLVGRSVTNAGTLTLGSAASAANIELDGNASLTNQGTLTLQNGAIADASGIAGSLNLINEAGATISKTGAAGFNLGVTLDNQGSVNVTAGGLTVSTFASGQNPGTITIEAGSALAHGSGALTNTGTINASGTLDLAGATLTNAGTVSPGGAGATGTLTIVGDYAQTGSGQVDAELASSSDYDRITASGTINLDGRLVISQLGGYEPSVGASHTLLSCTGSGACLAGSFAQIDLPPGSTLSAVYAADSLSLNLTDAIKRWITDADGDWNVGSNWSGGTVPVAGDHVVIDRGTANPIVTVTDPRVILDLVLTETVRIVSGGSLSVSQTVNLSGLLQVAGGSATIGGAVNGGNVSGGQVVVSAGTLTLNAVTALASLVQSSGGITQSGGALTVTAVDLSGGTTSVGGDATITTLTVGDTATASFTHTLTSGGAV
ncbi:MAG: filamentous hemagglutinin N-terminal domain-containing protein, partial [Rhodocyclaceae bacterium]|nr:filamentous hemagglutinin N-terminal domain-containing protein [Rhodocyclaceae bacterium]